MKLILKTITILLLTATITSCNNNDRCIRGEGTITTQILDVADFNKINLSISSKITISQGETQEVKVTGHPNIITELKTSINNNMLDIGLENGCYSNYELSLDITIPDINVIDVNSSGEVIINDFTNQSTLETSISGSGHITLNKFEGITNLNIDISGSGHFEAEKDVSTLNNLTIDISGSGKYVGYKINSNIVTAQISGSGKAFITATQNLDATIAGSGKIYYKGNPEIIKNVTGSGKLINSN